MTRDGGNDIEMLDEPPRPSVEKRVEEFSKQISNGDMEVCFRTVRCLKNIVIGSERQKSMVMQQNIVPKLLSLLQEENTSIELKREIAVVLGSLAKGTRQQVACLVAGGTVQQLLTSLLASDTKLVEACLRCLRNIYCTDMAPVDLVYQGQHVIPTLLQVISLSNCSKQCVSVILSRCCLTEMHQGVLCHAGLIDAVAPLLTSGIKQLQLPSLTCYATLCFANPETSAAVLSASFRGVPVLDHIVNLMNRNNDMELQIASAKCVAYLCRAGVIESNSKIVTEKAMPTLVRGCRDDPVLSSTQLRVEACSTLAYLTEADTALQQLTAANNQCLQMLSQCLLLLENQNWDKSFDLSRANEVNLREQLEQCALSTFASLCLTNEDIRRKVTMEIPLLVECVTGYLNREKADAKLLLASARCVHALTRSVEQLRTTFQDRMIWKPLLEMSQSDDQEIAAVGSAALCNLCLDFSPCREAIVEANGVEIMSALARKDEEVLRLNGVWGLMNLAFGADESLKLRIMKTLGADEILRLLTESLPGSPVVLRLLGLIRNCLAQAHENRWDQHIDKLIREHGNQVIQTVVFVLEGEYTIEAKELALCILSNIAAGDSSKDFIITNEDILRKIANYMMASTPQLQVAATFCVCNLVWKDDQGFMERQLKLQELGIYKILQQLQQTTNTALVDRVKQALSQFG